MKNKKNGRSVRKAGLVSGCLLGMVVCILFFASVDNGVIDNDNVEIVEDKGVFRQVILPFLGEADPGSGASGVLEVYVNTTGDSYTTNVTGEYEKGETNNSHIGSNVPFGTNFDVVVKVRWNKTHAYDSAWNLSLVRAYSNCTALSVSGVEMNEAQVTAGVSSDFIIVHYFLRDSDGGAGAGFTITEGQNVGSFSINFESLFYP